MRLQTKTLQTTSALCLETDGIQLHTADRSMDCSKCYDSQTSNTPENLGVGLRAAMCPMGLQMSSGCRQLATVRDAKQSSHLISVLISFAVLQHMYSAQY